MRFARLHGELEAAPAGLKELVSSARLDFLQLDYQRPRQVAVQGDRYPELPPFASGFADTLRVLAKTLFLEPHFRVVSSAGWESAFDCIEQAAGGLVEAGCGDVPVAAVRGSNLLPIIDMLQGQGIDLRHAETGAPFRELRAPLLAADLQLGAGPLAAALAEGARVVVAGCLDAASPATAMAVSEFNWQWNELNRLAAIAAAARAAEWCDWQGAEMTSDATALAALSQPPIVEIDSQAGTIVETVAEDDAAASRLQSWLRSPGRGAASPVHPDVRLGISRIICEPAAPRQISIHGAEGSSSDDRWRLEILYLAGYAVEILVEFAADASARLRRQMVEIARSHLGPDDPGGILTVQELRPLGAAGSLGWLRLEYQSKVRRACQHFLDQTTRLVSSQRQVMRLASGAPSIVALCGLWPARVSRDAVDIAVETRLAKEWI
jgi:hypothetical protein